MNTGKVIDLYECKTKVRRLYDDYKRFPSKLQKEFPFINYVDFQLELQNKTGMIRNKYHELARDLLVEDRYRNLHKEAIDQLDNSTKRKEEQEVPIVSKGLYDEFPAVSDHHTTDLMEGKNQTLENESENSFDVNEFQEHDVDGHAATLEVEECEDIVISAASTSLVEPSYEVHGNRTLDIEECLDDSIHDVAYHMVSDIDSASYHSADDKLEDLCGIVSSQGDHHLASQLNVNDRMVASTVKHFDVAREMLATYGWSTPLTDEHGDSVFSLAEIHALREAIGMMKQNYLKLLADRDFLLEWDHICYVALQGNEEKVDKLAHELKVTMDSLQSAQLALQESQLQIEKLTEELSLAQSPSTADIVQLHTEAVDKNFISMGCSREVVTSITDISTGMSTLVENSREPIVVSSSPEVSVMTIDTGQFTGSSYVTMVDSPESCVVVHNATPSSTQGIHKVSSSWEYSSHVDLFPSPRSKSVTSFHEADFGCRLVDFQSQRHQLFDSSVFSDEPLTKVGAFYREYTVRSAHHFSFDPRTEDLMMCRCGLVPELYHPLWDGYTPSPEGGISRCKHPTQLFVGDYLQGKLSVIHHADMYPTWFATSMSQNSLMGAWLQDDYGVSWHDGLVSYHIHGSLAGAAERCCVIDATRYFYLYMANGCGIRLFWDPGGDRFDTMYWLIEDPSVLVDYAVTMICVFQPSDTSKFQRLGLLCFHQGDIVVESDWLDLPLASVRILSEWYSGIMVLILQALVSGNSVSARVLIWDPGGASLCTLSSWGRYWYIAELPSSLDSRDSQGHSGSEAFILTEGSGTLGSST